MVGTPLLHKIFDGEAERVNSVNMKNDIEDLRTMRGMRKLVLLPQAQHIVGFIGIIPAIITILADIYNRFYPSFELMDFADNLSILRFYGFLAFFLASVLPFLFDVSQSIVKYLGRLKYEPIEPKQSPKFTEKDVTVIMQITDTVMEDDQALRRRINTILEAPIAWLILVGHDALSREMARFFASFDDRRLRWVQAKTLDPRRWVHDEGKTKYHTRILVIADELVSWPENIMPWLLAPFEDPKMSAVGTLEHVTKLTDGSKDARQWNTKIIKWQEERNHDIILAQATGDDNGLAKRSVLGKTFAMRMDMMGRPNQPMTKLSFEADNVANKDLWKALGKVYIQYGPECFVHVASRNTEEAYKRMISEAPSK